MKENIVKLINEQINAELYSAYLYLAFADYYEEEGLSGYANYFEIQAAEELRQKDVRRRTLYHLFSPQHLSIEVQTKKHPDAIVSPYKVRKLNQLQSEIMDLYKDTEYAQYLELIEEPERDEQGKILSGMTYSDVDILMNAYEVCLNDYDIFR